MLVKLWNQLGFMKLINEDWNKTFFGFFYWLYHIFIKLKDSEKLLQINEYQKEY